VLLFNDEVISISDLNNANCMKMEAVSTFSVILNCVAKSVVLEASILITKHYLYPTNNGTSFFRPVARRFFPVCL
jgi:hypothetical protein